jgi:dienelactone hydrolase
MTFSDNAIVGSPVPVLSVSPVMLPAPDRGADLVVRISAPVTGRDLPVILFSHGNGCSADSYAPLVQFWAARGFVVIQPTHLDSRRLGLAQDDPRRPMIWRIRIADMKRLLDDLDMLLAAIPGLADRVDSSRIAVVGHSFGGQTASRLLGARTLAPAGRADESFSDPRIMLGVLLAAGGRGGDSLSEFATTNLNYLSSSFAELETPTLVVAGDDDHSPLTVRGPEWYSDAYHDSPGARCLLTLLGGQHMLGGISGFEAAETTDENPDRVAIVQRMSWAWLRSNFYSGDAAWDDARAALESLQPLEATVECKA